MVTRSRRRGFTLVELLVVIAIIGILIALLLPALNTVRESARRSLCSANQKQLTLAVNAYYEAQRTYPPSAFLQNGQIPGNTQAITGFSAGGECFSFLVKLLPHIEQGHIYEKVVFTAEAFDAQNEDRADDVIPLFNCPSYTGVADTTAMEYTAANKPALSQYKTLSATTLDVLEDTEAVVLSDGTSTTGMNPADGGAIHPYGRVRALPATSQTAILCETTEPKYAVWFDGSTAGLFGLDGGTTGGNVTLNNWTLSAGTDYSSSFGGGVDMRWGPSSNHAGLVIHSFADTNTRTVSNEIQANVYRALITRRSSDNGDIGDWFSN